MAKKLTGAVVCGSLALFLGGAATAADLIWAGDGTCTGKWDTVSANWKDQSTGLSAVFTPGDNVTFVDAGNASNVITIVDKSLEVGKIVFSNDMDFVFTGGFGRIVSQQSRFTSKIGDGLHGSGDWTKLGKGEVFMDTVSSMTNDIRILEGTFRVGTISIYYQNGPFHTSMIGCPYANPRQVYVGKNGKLDLSGAPHFNGNHYFPLAVGTDLKIDGGVVDWGWTANGEYARWNNLFLMDGSWTMPNTNPHLIVDGSNIVFGGSQPWRIANSSTSSTGSGEIAFGFDGQMTDIYVEDIPDTDFDAKIEQPVTKKDSIGWSQYAWAMPQKTWSGAFRKSGPGRLTIAVPRGGNTFTGDVEVVEGSLRFACPSMPGGITSASAPMGSGKVNRTYTVRKDGRLEVYQNNLQGDYQKDSCSLIDFAFLGGTLAFKEPANTREFYVLYASNELTFEDATIEYKGCNGLGFGKKLTIRGTQPFVFTNRANKVGNSTLNTYVRFGLGTNVTDVSVAEITGDGKPDAVIDTVFANGNWYSYSGNRTPNYYGGLSFTPNNFRKTGAGTMRVGPLAKDFIGDAHAGEGTLLLDCDLATDDNGSAVFVEDGAYLGGCGQITRPVNFESGAGLEVATSQGEGILELDDLNLVDGSGKVQVVNDTEIDPEKIKDLPVARVALAEGSAPLDVSRWSGRVAGTKVRCRVDLRDGVLYASATKGLTVIVR